MLKASEETCDKKCQKKPGRGVSEEAYEINKIHKLLVLLGAWQTSCETKYDIFTRLQNLVRKPVHGLHT